MFTHLLRPFSGIYGLITDLRNWLYAKRLFASYTPKSFVISVGNLTVGGTGKTPMVEYLIRRLIHRHRPMATLSRGYGRRTSGFRIVGPMDTADTVGDEPLQLYRKFVNLRSGDESPVTVCVGERRAEALERLRVERPNIEVVILDDAFQHRVVEPQVNLLLMDYNRPFYVDHPFPAGRLRERRHGAHRADAIVVTKCPNTLPASNRTQIEASIKPYTQAHVPVFFAGLQYDLPLSYVSGQPADNLKDVILVTGIADTKSLVTYVRERFGLQAHLSFSDHHAYTRADLQRIRQTGRPGSAILTTEKDWVKLDSLLTTDEKEIMPLYYLPVAMYFLQDEDLFWQVVRAKQAGMKADA